MDPVPGIHGDADLNDIFDDGEFYEAFSDYDEEEFDVPANYNNPQQQEAPDSDMNNQQRQTLGLIDLTGFEDIPDVDVPPSSTAASPEEGQVVLTDAQSLQLMLDVFPDIAINHALELITTRKAHTSAKCQRLISSILDDGDYPKESDDVNERKRKRCQSGSDSDENIAKFEKGEHVSGITGYRQHALNLLKDEFLDVPVRHIERILQEKRTIFDSYRTISTQLRNYDPISSPFSKVSKARPRRGHDDILASIGHEAPKELYAAKQKTKREVAKSLREREVRLAEEMNLAQAQVHGSITECLCCFDDFPINRMISCSSDIVHFVCKECARRYVEEEIGKARCRPVCFADPTCGGTFSRTALQDCLGHKTFERLEHLQQQEDLRLAGLDFLEECPFCDYKAELPPVEIDKEFRCENPKCRRTSCRLCQKNTHIPMSCEEAVKDQHLSVRHKVEEAKSEALIRRCNKCKNPFVKEHGCNKMACTTCRNSQCYVCSEDIISYEHFGHGKCPLHDNHEARHEKEIQEAEEEALAKIKVDRPDISAEELKIEVSEQVKRREQDRIQRAQVRDNDFDFHMAGNELRRGRALGNMVPPPVQPPVHAQMVDFFGRMFPLQMPIHQQQQQQPQPPPPPPPPPPPHLLPRPQPFHPRDMIPHVVNPRVHEIFMGQQRIQYVSHDGEPFKPHPRPNKHRPERGVRRPNALEQEVQRLNEEARRLRAMQEMEIHHRYVVRHMGMQGRNDDAQR